jgi:hypothetical protein
VTERGPAAPWYDRVVAELAQQGQSKSWLNRRSGVSRATIENWATQPKPPQAGTVAAVADVLRIPREEAARLAGLPVNVLTAVVADLAAVSDEDLAAEVLRRMKR